MFFEKAMFDSTGMRIGTQMGTAFFDNSGMRAGEMWGNRLTLDNRSGADLHVYGNRLDPISTFTYRYESRYPDPTLHTLRRNLLDEEPTYPLGRHRDLF